MTRVAPLDEQCLRRAKRGYTTRHVPTDVMRTLVAGEVRPGIGDLVLARVDKLGSHRKIELPSGRRAHLAVGDTIMVAFGNRYAPDQFEALVGTKLGKCHLVAAGGVAAVKVAKHDGMAEPTRITPLGLMGDAAGRPLNLSQFAVARDPRPRGITTLLVAGTAMNAGKTTTSAALIYALSRFGHKVAGIKGTGTGAGGDVWQMADMGAHVALDFIDAGVPSTYLVPGETIERNVMCLIGHAADQGCDVAVVEIADGLQHEETAVLLRSARLRELSKGIMFAANDALGAQAGVQTLREWGHNVLGLSGQLTRSPLAMREALRSTGVPVVTVSDLRSGALSAAVLGGEAIRSSEDADAEAIGDLRNTASMEARPVIAAVA